MSEAEQCGSCGAAMEFFFLAPGDRAARCPYCGNVVDLPDDVPADMQNVSAPHIPAASAPRVENRSAPQAQQQQAAQNWEQARSSDGYSFVDRRSGQVRSFSAQQLPPQARQLLNQMGPSLPAGVRQVMQAAGLGAGTAGLAAAAASALTGGGQQHGHRQHGHQQGYQQQRGFQQQQGYQQQPQNSPLGGGLGALAGALAGGTPQRGGMGGGALGQMAQALAGGTPQQPRGRARAQAGAPGADAMAQLMKNLFS